MEDRLRTSKTHEYLDKMPAREFVREGALGHFSAMAWRKANEVLSALESLEKQNKREVSENNATEINLPPESLPFEWSLGYPREGDLLRHGGKLYVATHDFEAFTCPQVGIVKGTSRRPDAEKPYNGK